MKGLSRTARSLSLRLLVAISVLLLLQYLVALTRSTYSRTTDINTNPGFNALREQLNMSIKKLAYAEGPSYGYSLATLCDDTEASHNKSAKAADDATRLITDIFAINSHSNTTNDRTIESFFQSMSVPETELDTRRVCESAARHFAQVSYFPVHSDELTLMTTDEAFAHTCLLHSVVQKLEQNAIDSFVWWGSLLGSYRHHGPIPWHLDNDLLVDDKHREKVVQVLHKWRHDDFGSFLWKWHSGREGVNIKMWYSRAERISPTHKYRYPFLDIWFYTVDGDTLRLNYWTEEEKAGVALAPVAPGSAIKSSRLYTHEKHKDKYDDMHTVYRKQDFLPLVKRYYGGALVGAPVNSARLLYDKFGNFDVSCFLGGWNHRKEVWVASRPFDCCAVYGRVPFVERSHVHSHDGTLLLVETLKANNTTVHHLLVDQHQRMVYMPP